MYTCVYIYTYTYVDMYTHIHICKKTHLLLLLDDFALGGLGLFAQLKHFFAQRQLAGLHCFKLRAQPLQLLLVTPRRY